MSLRLAVLGLLALLSSSLMASENPPRDSHDGLWSRINERDIPARPGAERRLVPQTYRTFAVAVAAMKAALKKAPREFTAGADFNATVITLPMPDGTYARFAIQESPIMAPDLAAALPEVRTYRAQGLDDPTASGRLDFTPEGFHGFILSSAGAVYIDPYRRGDTAHYMSYRRRDYARAAGSPPFTCEATRTRPNRDGASRLTADDAGRLVALVASGANLRTYRLALAATGEYTAFHGGTVAGAQAAMVTTMNRVNGIYEREVAIRMVMVSNSSIVYTNAVSDPFTNTSSDLNATQTTIDSIIGAANYDIGHLFGTAGSGLAAIESVCFTGYKAKGLTGSSSPAGDAFDVDYVAHEMGHQFGAEHTFNGTAAGCGGNRVSDSAYEPGSGSTIMGYAGLCEWENVQLHSDAYFHGRSYDQIVAYSTDTRPDWGGFCAAISLTSNNPPSVTPGPVVTIPSRTPFALTGAATDPDGELLTYAWEQYDLGSASPPPLSDDGQRPLFRSFTPTSSPTRIFPKLSDILGGTTPVGEVLPTTSRSMTFRLTVRDNRAGGGGVNFGYRTVNVAGGAGPFRVNSPFTTWSGGSTQIVSWQVANTDLAPVSCANVNILLSSNGGTSFDTTILAGTPNRGVADITVPNVATTTARIKVECATSPFFNISPMNFTIVIVPAAPANVVATAIAATTVRLSWTGVANATAYEIYGRAPDAGGFGTPTRYNLPPGLIGNTGTLTYDVTQPAGTAYLYKILAVADSTKSADSNVDVATTVLFTDDPLLTGTTIKAVHLSEVRTAMAALRLQAALGPASVTDGSLSGTIIKSVHVTELQSQIQEARNAILLPTLMFSTTAAAGTTVARTEIMELRNAVK